MDDLLYVSAPYYLYQRLYIKIYQNDVDWNVLSPLESQNVLILKLEVYIFAYLIN